jgi:hypothetical protein
MARFPSIKTVIALSFSSSRLLYYPREVQKVLFVMILDPGIQVCEIPEECKRDPADGRKIILGLGLNVIQRSGSWVDPDGVTVVWILICPDVEERSGD